MPFYRAKLRNKWLSAITFIDAKKEVVRPNLLPLFLQQRKKKVVEDDRLLLPFLTTASVKWLQFLRVQIDPDLFNITNAFAQSPLFIIYNTANHSNSGLFSSIASSASAVG